MKDAWKFDTKVVHVGHQPDECTGAVSQPIVPAVAYAFPNADAAAAVVSGQVEGTFYGRYGNPTTRTLELKIAELESGEDAIALSSGMAAISSALLAFLQHGDHVVVTKDIYGAHITLSLRWALALVLAMTSWTVRTLRLWSCPFKRILKPFM